MTKSPSSSSSSSSSLNEETNGEPSSPKKMMKRVRFSIDVPPEKIPSDPIADEVHGGAKRSKEEEEVVSVLDQKDGSYEGGGISRKIIELLSKEEKIMEQVPKYRTDVDYYCNLMLSS